MPSVLGLDVGDRRIGVAVSESGFLAQRHSVIQRRQLTKDLETILRLVQDNEIGAVVVGVPYSLDGGTGPQAQSTLRFANALSRRCPVPVHLQDEALSTKNGMQNLVEQGVRRKSRRELIDAEAAAVLLQEYLDTNSPELASFL